MTAAKIPGNYSSHSFRIGAATVAARNGVPDHLIQTLGRWSTNVYKSYIRTPVEALASTSVQLTKLKTIKEGCCSSVILVGLVLGSVWSWRFHGNLATESSSKHLGRFSVVSVARLPWLPPWMGVVRREQLLPRYPTPNLSLTMSFNSWIHVNCAVDLCFTSFELKFGGLIFQIDMKILSSVRFCPTFPHESTALFIL